MLLTDNHNQDNTGHNIILNNLIRTVMSQVNLILLFMNSEMFKELTTQVLLLLSKVSPHYSAFIITPTTEIYSHIDDVLFNERLRDLYIHLLDSHCCPCLFNIVPNKMEQHT